MSHTCSSTFSVTMYFWSFPISSTSYRREQCIWFQPLWLVSVVGGTSHMVLKKFSASITATVKILMLEDINLILQQPSTNWKLCFLSMSICQIHAFTYLFKNHSCFFVSLRKKVFKVESTLVHFPWERCWYSQDAMNCYQTYFMTTAFLPVVICPWWVNGRSFLLFTFHSFPAIATVFPSKFHDNPRRAARLNPAITHPVWCSPSKYGFGKRCKKLYNDQIWQDLFSNLNSSNSVIFGYFILLPKYMMSPDNVIIYFFCSLSPFYLYKIMGLNVTKLLILIMWKHISQFNQMFYEKCIFLPVLHVF